MEEKEMLIVASKMKKTVKELGFNCSGDVAKALSDQIHEVLAGAAENAKIAKRKTIQVRDL